MSTHAVAWEDADTQRLRRPPAAGARLGDMDLRPPQGPVPAEVLRYFERAVAGEARRARARPPGTTEESRSPWTRRSTRR